jgi:hypothetical protein
VTLSFARVFRWFWQPVRRFFWVRVLVLGEPVHLNVRLPVHLVDLDESAVGKLAQEHANVAGVVGKYLCLDLGVAALHAPVAVYERPQAGEEQAGQRVALGQ